MASITDITTKTLDGTGIFDQLIQSMTNHLVKEHSEGRITGPEYSRVYLAMLETALGQSTQLINTFAQVDLINKQIEATTQQILNLQQEGILLTAQISKTNKETELLEQKRQTEIAQIDASNVQEGSVIEKQIALYKNQADGYLRDAEQKAARLWVDSWVVRRTTDTTGVEANSDNKLSNTYIGNVMTKLSEGINVAAPTESVNEITITSNPVQTATQGVVYTYNITAEDLDNETLIFAVNFKPNWLTLTDNGNGNATLSGTPLVGDLGENAVEIIVNDGNVLDMQVFSILVTA